MSARAELVSIVNDIRLNFGRGQGTLAEVADRIEEICSRIEGPSLAEISTRVEGGQPNGIGEIEPSDHREWFREEWETHHRVVTTLYGPWIEGSVKAVGGEAWTDHTSLVAALNAHRVGVRDA